MRAWLSPLAAGIAIAVVFIALNYRAYDGFFQDDELDNLSWAPFAGRRANSRSALATAAVPVNNFRPAGHLYFTRDGEALFGEDFPPYMTPIFAFHLLNGLLIFAAAPKNADSDRGMRLAAVAFFTLSAAAFDAYWKPMYVFDLSVHHVQPREHSALRASAVGAQLCRILVRIQIEGTRR